MEKIKGKINNQRLVTEEYLDRRLDLFHQNLDKRFEKREEATKEYLDRRLGDFREETREQTAEILQGVDAILVRFDAAEKDHAAHAMLHGCITDDLHGHNLRIKKLEARAA